MYCKICLVITTSFHSSRLITLLENCEHSGSTIKFRHCLPSIEICLVRLDFKASLATWDWALDTVVGHVSNLELPTIEELEEEERLVLESDENYCKHISLVQDVTSLLESLNERSKKFDDERISQMKCCLIKHCIQLMGKPLSFMNVSTVKNGLPTIAKEACLKLNHIISSNCSDHVKLVDMQGFYASCSNLKALAKIDETEKNQLLLHWTFGVGTLMYSNFQDGQSTIPLCYDPFYLLNIHLPIVIQMLQFVRGQQPSFYFCHEKALYLCKSLIEKISKGSVPSDVFEDEKQCELVTKMHQVVIYHNMESVRKLCYEVYNRYFIVFGQSSDKSLAMMMNLVLKKANHSGLIGHAIGRLKDHLVKILQEKIKPTNELCRSNLHHLIKRFCKLSHGAETDLLEVSDEIMSSLNFLICIFLRDRDNVLCLWDIASYIQDDFITPLEKGITLSRGHYKLKLEEAGSIKNPSSSESEVTLMVGGQPLPEMSKDQMRQVIDSALVSA